MPVFSGHDLRQAFGSFMTGVTVVTARTRSGALVGFTANSFTSVSLDPPLLAVCPGKHLNSFDVFNTITHFAVNILGEGQEHISNTFAKAGDDRFAHIATHRDECGTPLIDGACATFSCKVHQRHEAGDHMILIGEVLSFEHTHSQGLGYCHTGYFSLSQEQRSDSASQTTHIGMSGVIIEFDGRVLIQQTDSGVQLPLVAQAGAVGARSTLQAHFKSLHADFALGPVYSVFDNDSKGHRYTYFRVQATSFNAHNLGEFQPISHLHKLTFNDAAEATMMQRFVTEHENQVFGLYLGNSESGEVHATTHEQD